MLRIQSPRWLVLECEPCYFELSQSHPYFPRFPLYTKGVDTYRFEYAVFLLNKDIELVRISLDHIGLSLTGLLLFVMLGQLMADRNLRALDLRHTLPNLKNLLLTLTSNENIRLR